MTDSQLEAQVLAIERAVISLWMTQVLAEKGKRLPATVNEFFEDPTRQRSEAYTVRSVGALARGWTSIVAFASASFVASNVAVVSASHTRSAVFLPDTETKAAYSGSPLV